MRFSQESSSNANVVRGYDRGLLRINERVLTHSVIVAPDALREEPGLAGVADLNAEHAARILQFAPELVLLGTGTRQIFPAAGFGAGFLESGIGFEVMDTGAACRTFNVLVGEHRRVVALLIL